MKQNTKATMAIIAALLVLITTMLDPRISAVLAIILFVAFAIYKIVRPA